jgi:beta-hydroxylase
VTSEILHLPPNVDLADRRLRLKPPSGPIDRASRRLKDFMEARVVGWSLLEDRPVYDPAEFPWAAEIEAEWTRIRAELDRIMSFKDDLPSFHEILAEVGSISSDQSWKTYFLAGIGMDCAGNAGRCPETMRLLSKIPGVKTAFFSILSPGKHIPPHRGAYCGILRYHLGLIVPEPKEKCRIRIADRLYNWDEGKSLIFDDTYNHEVWNDTGGHRVVLFVDFARPLKRPFNRLNEAVLNMASLAPFLREAGDKQKAWEKKFYRQ